MPTAQQPAEPSIILSQAKLYGLTVDKVDEWWPYVAEFLQKAVDRSDEKYSLESVYHAIMEKKFQLWIAFTDRVVASCTTTVCEFPLKKVCIANFLGGEDIDAWIHTMNDLEKIARDEWGCDYMEIMGREGWRKVLPEYEKTYVTLRKKLNG